MAEMGETLRPDFALVGPAGTDTAGQAQLLIASYPADQALDKPVTGKHWKATPATRMMELLHAAGVPLGLVTNGEHWMLVYAPRGETTGYASWYGALWMDEPITLRAFHSLLGVRRFFGVAADSTLAGAAQGKRQGSAGSHRPARLPGPRGRRGAGAGLRPLDRGIRPHAAQRRVRNRPLRRRADRDDAARLPLLRRRARPAASGQAALRRELCRLHAAGTVAGSRRPHGEEVLERRFDAWARLLATFRAVHGGVQHQDLLLPAYGGSLFDPDRYPFLEGRAAGTNWRTTQAEPLAVNNRVVLHLLKSLQMSAGQSARRRAGGSAAGFLPRARHRTDRPRLRGPARPHRRACTRAGARPQRHQRKGAGNPARDTGSIPAARARQADRVSQGGNRPLRLGTQTRSGRRQPRSTSTSCSSPAATTRRLLERVSPLRRAYPRRLVSSARWSCIAGQHLRHRGHRPAQHRHALHAAVADRTHRPAHAGAAGL